MTQDITAGITSMRQGKGTSVYQQGIAHGEQIFLHVYQGDILTSEQIYELLMTMLRNPAHTSLWNAGCVMGWTKAYHQHPPVLHAVPDAMLVEQPRQQEVARLLEYVREGELTLREAANTLDSFLLRPPGRTVR